MDLSYSKRKFGQSESMGAAGASLHESRYQNGGRNGIQKSEAKVSAQLDYGRYLGRCVAP